MLSRRGSSVVSSATVRIADAVTRLRQSGVSVLDFSAGRPPEHTPAYIAEAAARCMVTGDTHQTMAQGKREFREACRAKLRRENGIAADPETEIVATLGVKHGILMTLLATLDPGDEVLIEDPCFVSYAAVIEACGGTVRRVPLLPERQYRWAAEQLDAAVGPRTRAILVCSPHNPLGIVHTRADLQAIADVATRNSLLVIADETYERLVWGNGSHISLSTLPGMAERTVTLMGLTKAFAMGGWRVGFAYAPPPVISALVTLQQHLNTCVSSIAQTGATVALKDEPAAEVRELWREWERRCEWTTQELAKVAGVRCLAPQGGFYVWIDVRDLTLDSERLAARLLNEHHLALVPGDAFGATGAGFLRMTSVRGWEELREGVARLRRALPEVTR
jgi:aspartate/methionine/tyrosine aminotransferase